MSKSVAGKQSSHKALPKIRALMGGVEGMRAAGETYLPREPRESRAAWEARRDRSFLFNGLRKTVTDMGGKVFSKPVTLAEEADERLRVWSENIDLQGRALNNFAYEVFKDGLQAGISYILADSPPRAEGETRATERRPYLVHVPEERFLGFKAEDRDGAMVLVQVRIMETVTESDPEDEFAEKTITQVRVFDLIEGRVQIRIFRKAQAGDEWVEWSDGARQTDLPEITIVPVYTNRSGFMRGDPPLEDLADINIAHWQSQSDQRNILHVARVPILFGAGFQPGVDADGNEVEVSVQSLMTSSDPNAKLGWVEHSGAAIDSGRQDLKDLEFQMQTFGLELLIPRAPNATATGEVVDRAKMTSPLAMMADNLADALEQAMAFMAMHAAIGAADTTVTVNKDFGISALHQYELVALLQMVTTGQISHERFISELVRRGLLADDTTAEEERDRIEDEGGDFNLPEDQDAAA